MRELGFDYNFRHYDKNGNLLYNSGWLPNQVSDDGFELIYDVFFRGATAPTGFSIGLAKVPISQDDSLDDVTEITGTSYSRQTVERSAVGFPTLALDSGDMQIVSKEVVFENTGETAWDGATDAFLVADLATDVLVCWRALSSTRTLQPGDKLNVTMKIKGKQPA